MIREIINIFKRSLIDIFSMTIKEIINIIDDYNKFLIIEVIYRKEKNLK